MPCSRHPPDQPDSVPVIVKGPRRQRVCLAVCIILAHILALRCLHPHRQHASLLIPSSTDATTRQQPEPQPQPQPQSHPQLESQLHHEHHHRAMPPRTPSLPTTFTDSKPLPKLLVFDLDYTLWPFWIDTHVTPPLKPAPAASPPYSVAHDSAGDALAFYPDVPGILHAAHTAGIQVAAASRTHAPDLARQLLRLLRVYPPGVPLAAASAAAAAASDGQGEAMPANRYFDDMQIFPGDKVAHFKKIHAATGVAYKDMVFFDDEARNRNVERELGVLFVLVARGVDAAVVDRGVERWRALRAKG